MYRKHEVSGSGYRPFEQDTTAIRMRIKMLWFLLTAAILLHIACVTTFFFTRLDTLEREVLTKYYLAVSLCQIHEFACSLSIPFQLQDQVFRIKAGELALYIYETFKEPLADAYLKTLSLLKWSLLIYLLLPVTLIYYFRRSRADKEKRHVEGAELITPKKLKSWLKSLKTYLPFGPVGMPISAETEHVFVIGSPGVGKTNFLYQVIEALIRRGDPVIIYDSKGDFTRIFYRPGVDLIFNPVLVDSLKWNVFNDIKRERDIDSIAAYLIPDNKRASQPFFERAARDVFAGILQYLISQDRRSNRDIFETLRMDREALAQALKDCDAARDGYDPISIPASNQAAGVIATLKQHTTFFKYMEDGDFSVDAWCERPRGNIFVLSTPDMEATLKPIFSLFINLFGRKLLSLPDDKDRRIFFLLDEFGSLQELQAIIALLTRSRSKGGSCWIGVQDVGQIENIYGKSLKETIINACATKFLMRVTDPATQKYLSEIIGESTVIVPEETRSLGLKDQKDGISVSHRERTQALVMPAEFGKLHKGEGYVTFPDVAAFAKIQTEYKKFPVRVLAVKEKDAVKEKTDLPKQDSAFLPQTLPESAGIAPEPVKESREADIGLFSDLMNMEE